MQDAPAQAKELDMSWHIDQALPGRLRGDAINFSAHGQITVCASVAEEDSPSVLLKIEVADQGIGISPEQRTLLFRYLPRLMTLLVAITAAHDRA